MAEHLERHGVVEPRDGPADGAQRGGVEARAVARQRGEVLARVLAQPLFGRVV